MQQASSPGPNAGAGLAWLRPVLSIIATLAVFLIAYGVVYNLGRPRNPHPDPALAARLLPLELLLGLVAGNFLHVSTTILFETSPEHRLNWPKLAATLAGLLLALAVA